MPAHRLERPSALPPILPLLAALVALACGGDGGAGGGGYTPDPETAPASQAPDRPTADAADRGSDAAGQAPDRARAGAADRRGRDTAGASRRADVTVFRRHSVPLPGSPGTPAVTLLVPEGWRVEGGMQRTPPALRNMYALTDLLVEAPDGRSFHYYPALSFNYSDYTRAQPMQPMDGSYFLAPPQSIGDWILQMARLYPDPGVSNLRLVREEPLPELTALMQRMHGAQLQELRQMAVAQGGATFGNLGGSRVVFEYEQDGRAMEETFLVGWRIMGMNTYGQVAMANWGVSDMRSIAGPAGTDYMNDPVLITIAQSLRFTPEYFQAMHRYYQQTFRRPPSRSVAQLQDEGKSVGDILHDGWKTRSGMTDAGQSRVVDMIHERTPYPSPDGGTVYLSSHYDRVFSDGQDRYILTDDANWDPRTDPGFRDRSWQALQPIRR